MIDSLSTIAAHVASTLPDSITARKEILVALANILTTKHRAFSAVQAQLATIQTLEQLQKELPLQFSSSVKSVVRKE